jgi:hypothetical protein
MAHAGERGATEGAEATLLRIIRERDSKFEQAAVGARAGASAFIDGVRGFLSSLETRRTAAVVPPAPAQDAEIVPDVAAAAPDPQPAAPAVDEGCTCGHICPSRLEMETEDAECVHTPDCALMRQPVQSERSGPPPEPA